MSKLARMRAARSSIAPCVATVMSLAVVCAGSEVRDARPQSALQARVADGGRRTPRRRRCSIPSSTSTTSTSPRWPSSGGAGA